MRWWPLPALLLPAAAAGLAQEQAAAPACPGAGECELLDDAKSVEFFLMQRTLALEPQQPPLDLAGPSASASAAAAAGAAAAGEGQGRGPVAANVTATDGFVNVRDSAENATEALFQQEVYPNLLGVEAKSHQLGPARSMHLGLLVFLFSAILSAGVCCMQSRVGSWFMMFLASAPTSKRIPGRTDATFPKAPMESDWERMVKESKQPSTAFTGSTKCLMDMVAGKTSELSLGTKSGNMVLSVTKQPTGCQGQVVKIEVLQVLQRTEVSSCLSETGPNWSVRDAAGTFAGSLGPAEEPFSKGGSRYNLVQGSTTVLTIEGPKTGRPSPGQGAFTARGASGGILGSLVLDEDDVEVTLMHSAMDSVVMVSLLGLFLLRPEKP